MKKTNKLVTIPTLAALSLTLLAGSPAMSAAGGDAQSPTAASQSQSQTVGQATASNQAIKIELASKVTLTTAKKSTGGTRYTTTNLNMRTGGSTKFKVITRIPKGKAVTWTGRVAIDKNWVQVKYGSKTGWVSRSYLGVKAPTKTKTVTVKKSAAKVQAKGGKRYTTTNLNMRTGGSTKFKVITRIPKGKAVTWTGRVAIDKNWVQVKYGSKTGWVSRSYLGVKAPTVAVKRTSSTTQAKGMSAVVAAAYSGVGTPYVFGGKTTKGWDCSGFTAWAYAKAGYSIPSSTKSILASGKFVKTNSPKPGDLVFQNNNNHVGIYVGNGQMVGAQNPTVDTILHKVTRNPLSGYYTLKNK